MSRNCSCRPSGKLVTLCGTFHANQWTNGLTGLASGSSTMITYDLAPATGLQESWGETPSAYPLCFLGMAAMAPTVADVTLMTPPPAVSAQSFARGTPLPFMACCTMAAASSSGMTPACAAMGNAVNHTIAIASPTGPAICALPASVKKPVTNGSNF